MFHSSSFQLLIGSLLQVYGKFSYTCYRWPFLQIKGRLVRKMFRIYLYWFLRLQTYFFHCGFLFTHSSPAQNHTYIIYGVFQSPQIKLTHVSSTSILELLCCIIFPFTLPPIVIPQSWLLLLTTTDTKISIFIIDTIGGYRLMTQMVL